MKEHIRSTCIVSRRHTVSFGTDSLRRPVIHFQAWPFVAGLTLTGGQCRKLRNAMYHGGKVAFPELRVVIRAGPYATFWEKPFIDLEIGRHEVVSVLSEPEDHCRFADAVAELAT